MHSDHPFISKPILIATRNSHKTEEIREMLGHDYQVIDLNAEECSHYPEVDETGTTFLENATLKAVEISKLSPGIILSDDSGLEVDALDGAPGVISARYAGKDGDNEANNAKLMSELKKLPHDCSRAARFRCVMVLAQDGEILASFDGSSEGSIISEITGHGGFGYDPLFVPKGYNQTFAQLGSDIKNSLSHRSIALKKAIQWLNNHS